MSPAVFMERCLAKVVGGNTRKELFPHGFFSVKNISKHVVIRQGNAISRVK